MSGRPPRRVFIGLYEVAGFYGRLAYGFAAIGIETTLVDLSTNPFRYPHPSAPLVVQLVTWTASKRAGTRGHHAAVRLVWRVLHKTMLMLLFVWATGRHDTFIFSYRSTFASYVELPLLRLLGKRIVYVFNGSDARPSYIDGADIGADRRLTPARLIAMTRKKRREIRVIERWASHIVAHPLYLHLFTREAFGIQTLGLPAPPAVHEIRGPSPPRHVRILHAPSNEKVKGTRAIRDAVAELVEEGLQIELIELGGVANEEVQRQLAACDFVVDQLYSDLPMSVFALEAAVAGKPAVVGSYGWRDIDEAIPARYVAPVERCHPSQVKDAVRRLAVDANYRRSLGESARRFARSWSARDVASRYARVITGDVPWDWVSAPAGCRYLHGVGLSEAEAREAVAEVLRAGGRRALALGHRPDLERLFVAFALGG